MVIAGGEGLLTGGAGFWGVLISLEVDVEEVRTVLLIFLPTV